MADQAFTPYWTIELRLASGEVVPVDPQPGTEITEDSLEAIKKHVSDLFAQGVWEIHVESGGVLRWFRPEEVREIRVVPASTPAAADTLRDELTDALRGQAMTAQPLRSKPDEWHISGYEAAFVDAVLPVALRYADAQVAAERERIDTALGILDAWVAGVNPARAHDRRFASLMRRALGGQP